MEKKETSIAAKHVSSTFQHHNPLIIIDFLPRSTIWGLIYEYDKSWLQGQRKSNIGLLHKTSEQPLSLSSENKSEWFEKE